jgi:hypothetical protein
MGSDDSTTPNYYTTLEPDAAKAIAHLRSVSADGSTADIAAQFEDVATEKSKDTEELKATEELVIIDEPEESEKSAEAEEIEPFHETTTTDESEEVADGEKAVDAKETAELTETTEVAASSNIEPEPKTSTVKPASMMDLAKEWNAQWDAHSGPKPVDTKHMRATWDHNASFAAIAKKTPEKLKAAPALMVKKTTENTPDPPAATVKKTIEKLNASAAPIAELVSVSPSTPAASNASTEFSFSTLTPRTEDDVFAPETKKDASILERAAAFQEKEVSASTNGDQAGEPTKNKHQNRKRGGKKAKKSAQPTEGSQSGASSADADTVEESESIQASSSPAPIESSKPTPETAELFAGDEEDATEAFPNYIDASQPANAKDGAIVERSPFVTPTEMGEPVDEQIVLDLAEMEKTEGTNDLPAPSTSTLTTAAQSTQEVVNPPQSAQKIAINPIFLINCGKKEPTETPKCADFFPAPASLAPSSSASGELFSEVSKNSNKKSGKARKMKAANAFTALTADDIDARVEAVMPGDEVERETREPERAGPKVEEAAELVAVKKNKKRGKKGSKKAQKEEQAARNAEARKMSVYISIAGAVDVLGGLVGYWMKGKER